MREGYAYDTAQYRYDIVSGMSDSNTRTIYQAWFNYPNPQSPQVTVGKNGIATVEPISVALIGPNVAQFVRAAAYHGDGRSGNDNMDGDAAISAGRIRPRIRSPHEPGRRHRDELPE